MALSDHPRKTINWKKHTSLCRLQKENHHLETMREPMVGEGVER